MKKTLVLTLLSFIFVILLTGGTQAASVDPHVEAIVEPMYVIYCPGNTPDGKHHFYNSAAKRSIKLKNSDGSYYKDFKSQPAKCKYCSTYIDYAFTELDSYLDSSAVYHSNWDIFGFTYWAYRSSVKPINSSAMVIHVYGN